jgi:hypothetical protein
MRPAMSASALRAEREEQAKRSKTAVSRSPIARLLRILGAVFDVLLFWK